MSDVSQGPGWWQASDGKWYAPEQAPGYVPPPPPPPMAAPAPDPSLAAPEPKKSHRGRWIAVGVVAVIVIIIIVASSSKKSNDNNATTASTAAGAAASTTPTTAPGTPGLNQVAKDGDFAFTVTSVQCGVTNLGTDPISTTASAGTQWCLANMSVTNDKSESQDFFADNQKAIDATGKSLSADTEALIYLPNNGTSSDSTVNPGVTITATVPFQISSTDSIKQLELHDSAFSGGVLVNVG